MAAVNLWWMLVLNLYIPMESSLQRLLLLLDEQLLLVRPDEEDNCSVLLDSNMSRRLEE
jgi:uncharacterized protein YhhL (DUF1145 family)